MKQVVIRGGATQVVEVPAPSPSAGSVLVANLASVISTGTERSAVVDAGGALPVRAIRNPELVRRAVEHLREHGLRETIDLARGTTAPDSLLGYSSAGIVLDSGGVAGFQVGQLVACAGAGRANHAELVSVPANLVAVVPEGVEASAAAFTTVGAIALQGVRRTEPTLGEQVVVVGLGLLGLLTVQILVAAGCQVLGVEPLAERRRLAERFGAFRSVAPDEALDAVGHWTASSGADAVVVTASSASDAILNQAIHMVRRRGRVVPVGAVGFGIEREALYVREADIRISTSYGPGRYDASYEEGGVDYPLPYVRWTENRNMTEFLRLLSTEQVRVKPLAELTIPIDRAADAYLAIKGEQPPLAAVLTYPGMSAPPAEVLDIGATRPSSRSDKVSVAIVGAGGFVRSVHVPNLKADDRATISIVVNRSGTTASDVARLVGGARAATDWRLAVEDPDIDLVLIGTRHDTHAKIATAALRAGKSVFVEKPLGLSRNEIDAVWAASRANPNLAIGFNRPFSPLAQQLAAEIAEASGPLHVVYRVSAPLPADHWLNDAAQGGGRILGEACHMYDFANWLCGVPERVAAVALPSESVVTTVESSTVTVQYADGSVATIVYSGVGSSRMPKERIEVLRGGRSWLLDDFSTLTSWIGRAEHVTQAKRQDKGHAALLTRVLSSCQGKAPWRPGPVAAYRAQSVALAALESIATGETVRVVRPSPGLISPGEE